MPAEGHKFDVALVTGLEADRLSGRDVEAHAERGQTVELQYPVDLEEVKMGADLNRVGRPCCGPGGEASAGPG